MRWPIPRQFRNFCVLRIAPTDALVAKLGPRTSAQNRIGPSPIPVLEEEAFNVPGCGLLHRDPLGASTSLTLPQEGADAQRRKTRVDGSKGTAVEPRHERSISGAIRAARWPAVWRRVARSRRERCSSACSPPRRSAAHHDQYRSRDQLPRPGHRGVYQWRLMHSGEMICAERPDHDA